MTGIDDDLEALLRSVLTERADDVPPDPLLVERVRARAARERPARVAGWALAGTAAAATVWLVAHALGAPAPAPGPAGPGVVEQRTTGTTAPPGRVPLTPGTFSASPDHPGGCDTFARGVPSTPEPPPSGATTTSPGASAPSSSAGAPAGSASPSTLGPGGLYQQMSWSGVSPAVEAVHWDLESVLDGRRFGGYDKDDSGRSVTVYVVRGPDSAAAVAIARGCARPGVPITIGYVDRSFDQLQGVGDALASTLPDAVKAVAFDNGPAAPERFQWWVDVRRNRVCVFVEAEPDAAARHELWVRYGDAVELWVMASRTLITAETS
jgi:hypothetical protein